MGYLNLDNVESFVMNISTTVRLHIVKLKNGHSLIYFTDNRDVNIPAPKGVFVYEDMCWFCYLFNRPLSVTDGKFFYLYPECKYQIDYNDVVILDVLA